MVFYLINSECATLQTLHTLNITHTHKTKHNIHTTHTHITNTHIDLPIEEWVSDFPISPVRLVQ